MSKVRPFWSNWPIALTLSLAIVILVFVVVMGVTFLSIRREQQTFQTELEQQADLILDALEVVTSDPLYYLDVDQLGDIMGTLGEDWQVLTFGRIYNAEGRIIADAFSEDVTYSLESDPFGRRLLESDTPIFEWQTHQLLAGRAVVVAGQRLGAISIGLPTASLNAKMIATRNEGLMVAVIAIIVGFSLMLLISRSITGPLRELAEATNYVANGDAQRKLSIAGSRELAVLAGAFNDMSDRLQETLSRMKQEILERKRAEEALRQARDELEVRVVERTADLAEANTQLQLEVQERTKAQSETRAILDAAGEAMILISPTRLVLSVNHRFGEFFGLDQDEIEGLRLRDLREHVERIFIDSEMLNIQMMTSTSDTERQFTQSLVQRWPVRRELELFSTPVRAGEREQYLGRLFVFRDVTNEREVARMKTELVSLVSHELRTPLTAIKGYIDLLLGGRAGEFAAMQLQFLKIVKDNTERLLSLINDMLDISRIESGKVEINCATLDIRHIISNIMRLLQPQMEAKNQQITLDLPSDLPFVWADADRVAAIVTNLLSNACKYTPAEGQITVAAYQEDSKVRVDIQDTGVGMTPEEQKQLFTKFFRSDNPMVRESGGTGLGLVITRSLVELQGGEIFVSSEPGQGSTFSFTLPITPTTANIS